MKTRRLDDHGRFLFGGTKILVTRLLAGQPIGMDPVDEDSWELFYGPIAFAELRLRHKQAHLVPLT